MNCGREREGERERGRERELTVFHCRKPSVPLQMIRLDDYKHT